MKQNENDRYLFVLFDLRDPLVLLNIERMKCGIIVRTTYDDLV